MEKAKQLWFTSYLIPHQPPGFALAPALATSCRQVWPEWPPSWHPVALASCHDVSAALCGVLLESAQLFCHKHQSECEGRNRPKATLTPREWSQSINAPISMSQMYIALPSTKVFRGLSAGALLPMQWPAQLWTNTSLSWLSPPLQFLSSLPPIPTFSLVFTFQISLPLASCISIQPSCKEESTCAPVVEGLFPGGSLRIAFDWRICITQGCTALLVPDNTQCQYWSTRASIPFLIGNSSARLAQIQTHCEDWGLCCNRVASQHLHLSTTSPPTPHTCQCGEHMYWSTAQHKSAFQGLFPSFRRCNRPLLRPLFSKGKPS